MFHLKSLIETRDMSFYECNDLTMTCENWDIFQRKTKKVGVKWVYKTKFHVNKYKGWSWSQGG